MSAPDKVSQTNAPKLHARGKEEERYDRQMRLWGESGQEALQRASVVVLGATNTSTELLKNLILPGIRHFTLVDGQQSMTESHIANNYFLSPEAVANSDSSSSLGSVLVECLKELNPACAKGARVCTSSPDEFVEAFLEGLSASCASEPSSSADNTAASTERPIVSTTDLVHELVAVAQAKRRVLESTRHLPTFTSGSSHVIVATKAVSFPLLCKLADALLVHTTPAADSDSPSLQRVLIPLVVVDTCGLTGSVLSQGQDSVIIHSAHQKDVPSYDLRMFNPFPALKEWFETHNPNDESQFNASTVEQHAHLPWFSILYHANKQRCEAGSEGVSGIPPLQAPHTSDDFAAVKSNVSKMIQRTSPPEEGFLEALNRCKRSPVVTPMIDSDLVDLLFTPFLSSISLKGGGLEWFALLGVKKFAEDRRASVAALQSTNPALSPNSISMLPLDGHLPDFTTLTPWFVELAKIYRGKMEEDVAAVVQLAWGALCSMYHIQPTSEVSSLTAEEQSMYASLCTVCKSVVQNIRELALVRFSSLKREFDFVGKKSTSSESERPYIAKYLNSNLMYEEENKLSTCLYIALTAGRIFAARNGGRFPGQPHTPKSLAARKAMHEALKVATGEVDAAEEMSEYYEATEDPTVPGKEQGLPEAEAATTNLPSWKEDAAELMRITLSEILRTQDLCKEDCVELLGEVGNSDSLHATLQVACYEVARGGGGEPAPVAAALGAVAAQEVIKIVQGRLIPATKPVVFNGYHNYFCVLERDE